MPVMDGITFLDNLRSIPRFRSLPVVVISALSSWARRNSSSIYVVGILAKGVSICRLLRNLID